MALNIKLLHQAANLTTSSAATLFVVTSGKSFVMTSFNLVNRDSNGVLVNVAMRKNTAGASTLVYSGTVPANSTFVIPAELIIAYEDGFSAVYAWAGTVDKIDVTVHGVERDL